MISCFTAINLRSHKNLITLDKKIITLDNRSKSSLRRRNKIMDNTFRVVVLEELT
jgi:hypothetical protein